MNVPFDNVIPWVAGGIGLLVAYHFISNASNRNEPTLANATNTADYPNFPMFGRENHTFTDSPDSMSPPLEWPHPYSHPRIPKYVYGGGDYYSNTAPITDPDYFMDNRKWYDRNEPPLLVTVSQNQPTAETYSHHHFYFDQKKEQMPIEYGEFKNIT